MALSPFCLKCTPIGQALMGLVACISSVCSLCHSLGNALTMSWTPRHANQKRSSSDVKGGLAKARWLVPGKEECVTKRSTRLECCESIIMSGVRVQALTLCWSRYEREGSRRTWLVARLCTAPLVFQQCSQPSLSQHCQLLNQGLKNQNSGLSRVR